MKKHIMLLLVSVLAVTTISGCGKDKSADAVINEIEATGDSLSSQDKAEIKEVQDEINQLKESETINELPADEAVVYKMYERTPDWHDNSVSYGGIQVDDVYYEPLMNLDELMSKVALSDAKYEFEYDPEHAMANNDQYEIKLKRDNKDWIIIMARNFSGENCSAKDSVLGGISVRDYAYEYSYTIGGMPYNDIIGLSLDELIKLVESTYVGSNIYDKASGDTITENISYDVIRMDTYDDGKAYNYSAGYSVVIDKNTNAVTAVVYNNPNSYTMIPVQTEDVTDFASLSETDKEAIMNYCLDTVKSDASLGGDLSSVEILGDYHDSSAGGRPAIGYVTVATYNDGSVKYINQRLHIGRDAVGNIQCSGDLIAFDDMDQAVKMIELK